METGYTRVNLRMKLAMKPAITPGHDAEMRAMICTGSRVENQSEWQWKMTQK